jgi:hypothetical protein
MDGAAVSERQIIQRKIFLLRQRIHEHLAANNAGATNLLLEEIAKLERELPGAQTTAPEREP